MTATSTILVQYIPKTLLTYQGKKVEMILKDLTAQLLGADEAKQIEIMAQINDYNKIKIKLNNELGRV